MPVRFVWLFSSVTLLLVAACGANVVAVASSTTAGAGGGSSSGSVSGTGGGCISPTVGEACSSGDVACQPPNPCCTGYEWACQSGAWQKLGLGCSCQTSPPFACGTTTCSAGFYCEVHPPGIAPPDGGTPADAYTCAAVPASCASTPTCACIDAAPSQPDSCGVGATCTEDASGNVTVVCVDA